MLQKQPIDISFAKGLDTKTDQWRVSVGNFLSLENSIFTKQGLLQKRNGFNRLTVLPDDSYTYLTTFNGGLTAIGQNLSAYSQGSETWVDKGIINPLDLNVNTLIRNNLNQSYADSAISDNGLVCTIYTENNNGALSYKYTIADNVTNQTVIAPTLITDAQLSNNFVRVFSLGFYFIIVFGGATGGGADLVYLAISTIIPTNVFGPTIISTTYSGASTGTVDGVVSGDNLYLFFNSTGTTITGIYLTRFLLLSSPVTFAGSASEISVTDDITAMSPVIWATWIDNGDGSIHSLATDTVLNTVLAPTLIVAAGAHPNVATAAQNGILTAYYETTNSYPYDGALPTNFISTNTVTQLGVIGTPAVLVRSVGLASKAFIVNGMEYFLSLYISPFQSTYFLINGLGNVVARIAYQNAPESYYNRGLPTVTVMGQNIYIPYLNKDLIAAVNKDTNLPSGTQTAGIYSQTGVNLLKITFGTEALVTTEIGNNLNISGGFMTMYDGIYPVEQNFFLYPDMDTENPAFGAIWATPGSPPGSIAAQPDGSTNTNAYYYQVTYEWTDNQGNAFRSAPSIPIAVTTTGSGTGSITVNVPTLRLTYKISSPVKIVIYRWSVGQQVYYQTTSITNPLINDPTIDQLTFVDTNSDASILGNNILYTTGGVVENIGPPPTSIMTLYQSRLWLVDSEDRNLLWFSKQVIEATPVEMSDLLTIYVAPTTASQGSTGPITALSAMDDKLIIFKQNAIYYINGEGPDNTGANNQFSDPIFVNSTVGCINQNSIVFIPQGLMFQSDKGIWLLGRDLSTQYIGAPVERYNSAKVLSAINIPSENQVRFTLDTGATLMYDYFFGQWGTFAGIPGISSTLYQGFHTFINSIGQVLQENPGSYLDGSDPVLLSFTTSWLNLAGLQGYERAYFFYILGRYLSPHKLQVSIAYDYNDSPWQSDLISPDNYGSTYGGQQANGQTIVYGQETPYGGPGDVEQWRVFLTKQKCQSFQVTIQEVYDATFGLPAGQGLTMSGLNLIVALKKGYRPISSANSIGGS